MRHYLLGLVSLSLILTSLALTGQSAEGVNDLGRPTQGSLPTPTPWPTPQLEEPAPAPPDYQDLTQGGAVDLSPQQLPSPTFIPVLMRKFRPQASMLGVALDGYFDAAGWQQTLALHPRLLRRWREMVWRAVKTVQVEYRWEGLAAQETRVLA